MATLTDSAAPAAASPPPSDRAVARPSRLRKVLLAVGLLFIVVMAWPAFRRSQAAYYIAQAREEMTKSEFTKALDAIGKAERAAPQSAEVQFLQAVLHRRTGQLNLVDAELRRAEQLGWPKADIDRQQLLLSAQVGRVDEVEDDLRGMLAAEDLDDLTALQVYEALSHGFWMNHRINDTLQVLEFWIKWRPQDVEPRLLRADVYNEFSDPVSAEREYTQILEFAPNHLLAREMLGKLLLSRGQVEAATEHFKFCVANGGETENVKSGLAECEFRSGRADEAAEWIQKIDFTGMDVERKAKIWKLQADIQRFQGDNKAASETLEKAIAIWPHDSGILQSLGQCYAALGEREKAEKHLERSKVITKRAEQYFELKRTVVRRPNDADLRFQIGSILVEQELPEEAANWWRSAVRCDWSHQPSHEALADYYQRLGREELESRFRISARAAIGATFQRAWLAVSRTDLERARELDKLLEKYPEVAPQHELLQTAFLVKAGKYDEAQPRLAKLLPSPVLRSFALTLEAEMLIAKGQVRDAEARLKEALQLDPNNLHAHRTMAVIYYDLGAIEQCESHLLQVAAGDPNDYRALRLLGLMSKDFENYADAVPRYQECLLRNPPKEVREEVIMEAADCLMRQRSYDEALAALDDATPSPERETARAECLYNQGKAAEAVKMLDEVLAEKPDLFTALALRGDASLVAGKVDEAAGFLKRAIEAQPFDHTTHFKLAQAYARGGKDELSEASRKRSEELKELRKQFAKLHEDAAAKPYDVEVRRQLAKTAELLGRPDLAVVWTKAADALVEKPKTDAP
ncbi:MAG: tetratricopeptide repeat protein [Pirellulales bacterium]